MSARSNVITVTRCHGRRGSWRSPSRSLPLPFAALWAIHLTVVVIFLALIFGAMALGWQFRFNLLILAAAGALYAAIYTPPAGHHVVQVAAPAHIHQTQADAAPGRHN